MSKVDEFLDSLVITNKTYEFFTDWHKARTNHDKFKDELALLGVLTSSDNPRDELKRLILTYPRINALIPLLNAVRIKDSKKTLFVLDKASTEGVQYYFGATDVSDDVVDRTVSFAEQTGLLAELVRVKNHGDYYFGVEVGIDTNGRKNRSGSAMEALVEPYIRDLAQKHNGIYLTQTNFEDAAKEFGVDLPPDQFNKRGDFMVLIDGKPYNIEANFFDGSGSKQEVINSYISRSQDLKAAGWGFAVVTDGLGWRKNRTQVEHAYATIGYIYNLSMCGQGALEDVLR